MDTIPTIHVHTASDKTTIGYVTFMWETMRAMANHPEALKLSVHGIGPTAGDRLRGMPNTTSYQVPTTGTESGSAAHGACVENALAMTDDGDIHILSDSDTVVLSKGWDDYVRIKLLDEKIGIIGTATEDIGGFSSGGGNVQMAKNLPTVAWCALSPLHSWRGLRAMPSKETNIAINNDTLSQVYNLPLGYHVLRDVGWQIPQYLWDNKITYQAWKQLKPSKAAVILKGLSDYHEEYHNKEDVPFIAHQRGSLRHRYREDKMSQTFYEAIDRYLVTEKALPEPRWKWSGNDATMATLAAMKREVAEVPTAAPATMMGTIEGHASGWVKATLDGNVVRSRHVQPVPKLLDISYVPDTTCRHLRLEGTTADLYVSVPPTQSRAHSLTVRNLTSGPVRVLTSTSARSVEIPRDKCWMLVVDTDGVIHAE